MKSYKQIIKIAQTEAIKQAIYKFRYQIYIEEMGKPYQQADHSKKILTDYLDDTATLLYAEQEGEIIGTVRINWGKDVETFKYFDDSNFGISIFKHFPPQTFSFNSRLMLSSKYRKSMLAKDLAEKSYFLGRNNQVQFNFISCNPLLTPFFFRLGFRNYKKSFLDQNSGEQIPMVLIVEDVEHLYTVKSPFLSEAFERKNNPIYAKWFSNFLKSKAKTEEPLTPTIFQTV